MWKLSMNFYSFIVINVVMNLSLSENSPDIRKYDMKESREAFYVISVTMLLAIKVSWTRTNKQSTKGWNWIAVYVVTELIPMWALECILDQSTKHSKLYMQGVVPCFQPFYEKL